MTTPSPDALRVLALTVMDPLREALLKCADAWERERWGRGVIRISGESDAARIIRQYEEREAKR